MESKFAHTEFGPIEYTLQGSGPVVLVLHGTSADCFHAMEPAPLLKAGFSILAPSRPGYGRTPLSVGRSADQAARSLVSLLDVLGIQSCRVIAISGGGPTGIALAALYPQRVECLVMLAAASDTAHRPLEPGYKSQQAFYGPGHELNWLMLRMVSKMAPARMASQTLATFSTHDPEDAMRRLTKDDILSICRFFQRPSSRAGAVNDATHTTEALLLQGIHAPTLVIHSREDRAVPIHHAEWSLQNIAGSSFFAGGFTGHFFWVGPDSEAINHRLVQFLNENDMQKNMESDPAVQSLDHCRAPPEADCPPNPDPPKESGSGFRGQVTFFR